jgi:hypothetical protein
MKHDYTLLYTALGLGTLSFLLDFVRRWFEFIPEKIGFTLLILGFVVSGIVVVFWIIKFFMNFVKEAKSEVKKRVNE